MAFVAAFATLALGQPAGDETPIGSKWWPSEWGAGDQRGAANRLTPAKVLRANQLVREGTVYQLGRLYENGMPVAGKRHFSLTIPGSPTYPPSGKNGLVAFDEKDAGVFLGRKQEITEYLGILDTLRGPDRSQVLVISGGSGCGKSSVLRAGLIPRGSRRCRSWEARGAGQ